MRGTMVKTQEARDFALGVAMLARTEKLRPLEGAVSIRIDVYRPRQSGDLDNRLKAILDALQGTGFHNDSQIVEIIARRFDDPKHPRVEVWIEEAQEKAA